MGKILKFLMLKQPDCQTLTHQIFKALQCLQETTVTICQNISRQILKSHYPSKFPHQNFVI